MRYKRNESDMPRPLDSQTEGPLVLGAHTCSPSWFDLGTIGHKTADLVDVLIIDNLDVFYTESAYPAPRHETTARASTGPPPGSWSAWPSAGPAPWRSGRPAPR
jgi:nicotinamidase-related amidase